MGATMSVANGADDPKTVGFLDLPTEVRDQIYRELLLQPIGYGAARQCREFETSILRANKQIHREASEVLYEENAWVIFEMRTRSKIERLIKDHYSIAISRGNALSGKLPFGGIPTLRVYLEEPRCRDSETLRYVVLPLEWVGHTTNAFVRGEYSGGLEMAVHFHTQRQHESRQRMVVEFLETLREIREVVVTGLNPPFLGRYLAEEMMTAIASTDELIDQTSEYIRRADLALAQGQVYRAEELYDQGSRNPVGYFESRFYEVSHEAAYEATPTQIEVFDSKTCECLEGVAVCSLRHGDSLSACTKLRMYLLTKHTLSDSQKARGFYYHGLAAVAAGLDHQALFSFLMALALVPGYEAVDKEVDALEGRVFKIKGCSKSKALIVKEVNLELIRPLRHKNAGDTKPSREERGNLALQFKHCDKNLRQFLRVKAGFFVL